MPQPATQNIPIAVAVSGGGRSLKNLLERQAHAPWQVAYVISSSPDCGAVQIANEHKIPLFVGDFSKSERSKTSAALASALSEHKISWIVLAGFLKLFPTLATWQNRVINIHPALLPKFGGKGMHGHHVHKAVLEAKDSISGATVHFVTEHYDEGAAISQIEVPVMQGDTPDDLAARIFAAECQLLPWTITELCAHRLPLAERKIKKMESSAHD